MLSESKILFDKIKDFRYLLTEGVGDNDIIDAIQNHEYIYIYYAGDENNKRGYRTIRPYVLGVSTAGNKVIRAWQDRGKSVSYFMGNRGNKHDYWGDDDGKTKPGWRMFRLDRIEKIYPTGRKFNNPDGTVKIPPEYKEGSDKNMTSIIAYVSSKTEPDFVPKEVIPTTGEKRTKWTNFNRGNRNNRKITANDVAKLRDIASRIYKKKLGSFLVAINNNDEFELIDVRDKDKVPELAIVGNLPNLYSTLVKTNVPADNKFFDTTRNKAKQEKEKAQTEIKETESSTIPIERKTFFK